MASRRTKPQKTEAEEEADTLLRIAESLEEQMEELRDESKLLMILASNGLVIACFTHELKGIRDHLVFRIDELSETIRPIVDMDRCNNLPDYQNPFTMIEDIRHEDKKLRGWLHYSLETLRRDKRRRTNRDLIQYLKNYKESWSMMCSERDIDFRLSLPVQKELKIRVFEADLDSILNNLLINSLEAFLKRDAPPERVVSLKLEVQDSDIHLLYTDSGPGLSKDIVPRERIFEPHFTTKRDPHTGEETGTGLGMWLVKSLVEENNGTISILDRTDGFGVHIILSNRVKVDEET